MLIWASSFRAVWSQGEVGDPPGHGGLTLFHSKLMGRSASRSVLVLTYWSAPDALIQTYTLPYIRQIKSALPASAAIHLLTLEQGNHSPEEAARIRARLRAEGIEWLPVRYSRFGLRMAVRLAFLLPRLVLLVMRERIAAIHAWCMPAGALGWLLSVVTGTPLVIDSYEPHAEAMAENGTWSRRGAAYRVLAWFERLATRRAGVLISCTGGFLEHAPRLYRTSFAHKRTFVKPACTDLEQFDPAMAKDAALLTELGLGGKVVAVYAGKFGGIYLRSEVFIFLAACYRHWKDDFRVLLLSNHPEEELKAWCAAAGLPTSVVVRRFVPHADIPRYMGLGDFGLCPVLPTPSKRYCTPIKNGEYWALGLPVVITPRISDDSDLIAQHNAGVIWDHTQPPGPAVEALATLLAEPASDRRSRIRQLAEAQRSFSIAAAIYQQVYGGDGANAASAR